MIVISEKTLKLFRGAGECECCQKWYSHREASHIIPRGMGGARRLDLPENLIAHGPDHHWRHHNPHAADEHYEVRQMALFEIVARREKFPSGEAVKAYLMAVLALPKNSELPVPEHLLARAK